MKHILLLTLISIGFTMGGHAAQNEHHRDDTHAMSDKQIKRMDRDHNINKTQIRDFHTLKEFQHKVHRLYARYLDRYGKYDNGRYYDRDTYRDHHRMNRQEGYRYGKRGWTLAYRYDRAAFYDDQGYYYGYFNRFGYFFEDVFYRYDRYYTYRDRVKGRGLFDHRYYRPVNYRYYGFCR